MNRKESEEINRGFREADYESWIDNPLVIGIEVILSNNHLIKDECDILAGKYPKDFKFIGWHLGCKCCSIPVTPSKEEVIEYVKAQAAGEDVYNWKFKGEVTDIPNSMKEWISKNKETFEKESIPEWITCNSKYTGISKK